MFTFSYESLLRVLLRVRTGVQGAQVAQRGNGQAQVAPHQGALSAEPATPAAAARVAGKVQRLSSSLFQSNLNKPLQGMALTECLPTDCLLACPLACPRTPLNSLECLLELIFNDHFNNIPHGHTHAWTRSPPLGLLSEPKIIFSRKYCLKILHLQIMTEMPMMRKLMQRIMSTMLISRKVKWTPANENSSVLPFTDLTLTTLVIMSTKGGSAIGVGV